MSPSNRPEADPPPLGVEALVRGALRRVGANRSEVVQPMDSLDVGLDGLVEFQPGADVCGQSRRARTRHPSMVDSHPVAASVAGNSCRLSAA